jgi:hypothetical protein
MRRLWLVVLVTLACGGGNRLNGTISSEASLQFDEVRAEWLVDELSVRYLRGADLLLEEPVRLTLPAELVDAGVEVAVEKRVRVEHFVSRGDQFGRLVAEKPFPQVGHGVVRLVRVGANVVDRVEGDFQVTFAGSEDTLNGEFVTTVSAPR